MDKIKYKIPFNKPYCTGKETEYINQALKGGKISGNGEFTEKCQKFFEDRYGFRKCLLTTSCTDALEMCAILINTVPGDEIIVPSYTFVSSANAFVLRGAKIVFADSSAENPNIDADKIESLITGKTKAIVIVHYAGISCDMDRIMEVANRNNIIVIEDAAQGVDSFYKGRPLGSIGNLAAFSFHETKNIISGEGGMLVVNDEWFAKRAEIIWEKGTNRAAFWRGEVDKYGWVDVGSSFLPSEIVAAFLFAQIENLDMIQKKRCAIWEFYQAKLKILEEKNIRLPSLPDYSTNNGHMFYILCRSAEERRSLIEYLKNKGIYAVFHYQSLHKSPFYSDKYNGPELNNSDIYTDILLRLPLFFELTEEQQSYITDSIIEFYG